MWNPKYSTSKPIYRTETPTDIENSSVVAKGCGGMGRTGSLGLVDANYYVSKDKQRGPAVQHRELYSVSWDRPRWKTIKKGTSK